MPEVVAFGAVVVYISFKCLLAESAMNPSPEKSVPAPWTDWPLWPYVIIGLTVLLRVLHVLNSEANPTFWEPAVDPAWYDQAAQAILRGDWGPFPLFRAPVYQTLLAGVYGLFGRDLVAARLLNIAFQGTTVWIIWKIGKSYFSSAVGILAGLLFALNGMTIYFACELVSTSAEMLAAALCLWSLLRLTRDRKPISFVLCGLAWGFAAITRPNFLTLFPLIVVVLWLLMTRDGRQNLKLKLTNIAIWVVFAFLPILPVTASNLIKSGEFVLIATQGGVNFWIGNNPQSTGILSVLPGYGNTWTMEDAEAEAERDVGHSLTPGQLSKYYYSKGKAFLAAHPFLTVRFMIRKTALFFNQFEISNNKHIVYFSALSPWLPYLQKLNFGILVPFALLGLWLFWKKPEIKIIVALIALYTVSVILFFITARFRMPIVPWITLLASAAIVWIIESLRARSPLRVWKPLLILIPGVVLAYINIWNLTEAPVGWARYMEGNAYLRMNKLDSARVCFFDALRDSQAVARTALNLGVVEFRSGNLLEAKKWYQNSADRDPGNQDAWNNLGTVYEALHDTAAAIQTYHRALLLNSSAADPRHNLAGLHFQLGIAALKRGDDSLAIRHLEICLSLESSAVAFYDLAIACGRLGQNSLAIDHLNRALQIDPRFAAAYQLRAQIESGHPAYPKAASAPQDSN